MPGPLTLPCPAKINLFLEVRGKRADGFHELGTLFQALEIGDILTAEPARTLEIAGAAGVTQNPEDNLILRAARALQARYPDRIPREAGLRFTLEKRLPMGAGLGGGSSDAATALRLANALWNLNLADEELQAVGLELGSDVPFFLATETEFATGRGEILSAAPDPLPFHVVVATPPCHVDTASAYRELAKTLNGNYGTRWPEFRADYESGGCEEVEFYRELHNDFEEPVMTLFPEIRDLRDRLQKFEPVKAMMTGSGASVFALFERETHAREALAAVAPACRFSVLTRFTNPGTFEFEPH
jgi:4-diphosphocytidyl-2-C-methyl-D-erythritol kinase